MSYIKKISLAGTEYDLKDAEGRDWLKELDARLSLLESMVLSNSYYAPLEAEDSITLLSDDDGTVIVADWSYSVA